MNRHRRIAVVGLVLGPLTFAVSDLVRRLVEPGGAAGPAQTVAAVHQHPSLWLLAGSLSLVSPILFLPGVVAAVGLVRGRGSMLTTAGGYLFGAGLVAAMGHMVGFFGLFGLYDQAGSPDSAIRALDAASERYPSLVGLIVLFVAGLVLGQLLLMVGLRRAGVVPTWAVVACLVEVVAGTTGGVPAGLVGLLAWVAAFVPVARAVRRAGADAAPVVVGDALAA
ncbi:MAG TPA: hypothetical protein VFJ09_07185 [Nocardioidaceae bacterium]|nr:hypothetical protein [Nocardioidaceae bacterium]